MRRALAIALSLCAQLAAAQPEAARRAGEASGDPTTRAGIAREIAAHERAVALAVPGTRACRRMTIGIATHDWIRGTVVGVEGLRVALRIEDAGRYPHRIGSAEVRAGEVVRDALEHWTPCVELR